MDTSTYKACKKLFRDFYGPITPEYLCQKGLPMKKFSTDHVRYRALRKMGLRKGPKDKGLLVIDDFNRYAMGNHAPWLKPLACIRRMPNENPTSRRKSGSGKINPTII